MPCPYCPRLSHFGMVRHAQGRVAGLASASSAWLFEPTPRRDMFSTLPHLPQGHPRLYGRCSSPTCFIKVNPQSRFGARLWPWGDSVARVGPNEIRPGASKFSLAGWRVAKTKMFLGSSA